MYESTTLSSTAGAANTQLKRSFAGIVALWCSVALSVAGCAEETPPIPEPQRPSVTEIDVSSNWRRVLVDPDMGDNAVFIAAAEIDQMDGLDLIAGRYWYVNPGSIHGIWIRKQIGSPLHNMAAVFDVDRDGFVDIVGTRGIGAEANARFVWARNTGFGTFTLHEIEQEAEGDFLQGVATTDLYDDGTVDLLLSWHTADQGLQRFRIPEKPRSESWLWDRISSASQDEDLSVADIDDDGDKDIFLGTQWLENPGQEGLEWHVHTIGETTEGLPDRNVLADFDGDGDLDAVVGLENGDDILLFISPEDPTKPWTRKVLVGGVGGGFSMDTGDIDGDGDPDVVVGEHRGTETNRVLILENNQNAGEWRILLVDEGPAESIDHHDGALLVDMDADGDLDIISVGWYNPKVWIYENLGE